MNKISDSIRDSKYNSGTMYAGTLKDMQKCRPLSSPRTIIDFHACNLNLTINTLPQVSDSVLIYHSPNGCIDDVRSMGTTVGTMRGMERKNPYQWDLNNIHICSTNITEVNTIYGSEKKLENAIREAKRRYNPQLIFVMSSCISAIIGDDIEAVCRKLQNEIDDTIIVPLKTQGFQTMSWTNTWDVMWSAFMDKIIKEQSEKQQNLVNVFVPFTITSGDIKEVERILNELDLEARFLLDLTTRDTIERIPDAILNTSVCKCFGYHAMVLLNEKYGMPFVDTVFLYGIKYSKQWIQAIASATGREELAEKLINKELEEIEPALKKYREKLSGLTVFISANHSRSIGWAQLCHELGMKVVGLNFHMVDDISKPNEQEILQELGDVHSVVGSPIYEEIVHVNRLKPDIAIAHGEIAQYISCLGIATLTIYNNSNQGTHLLFKGLVREAERLYRTYTNPVRKKILTIGNEFNEHKLLSMPFHNETEIFKFVDKTVCGSRKGPCKYSRNM